MEVLHHGLSPARLTRLRYPRMVLKERSQFKNIAFIGFVTRLAALRLASLLPCQLSSLAKEMLTFSCGKVRYIYFFFWILRKACMCLCSSISLTLWKMARSLTIPLTFSMGLLHISIAHSMFLPFGMRRSDFFLSSFCIPFALIQSSTSL